MTTKEAIQILSLMKNAWNIELRQRKEDVANVSYMGNKEALELAIQVLEQKERSIKK